MTWASSEESAQGKIVRPHQQVPILVLLQNHCDGSLDCGFEREDMVRAVLGIEGGEYALDCSLEFADQALGSRAQAVGLGLRQCAVKRCAECGKNVVTTDNHSV